MKDYRQLAFFYLKRNRKRTVITIIGTALCVAALFAILNFTVSYVVTKWNIQTEKSVSGIRLVSVNPDTAQKIAVKNLPDKDIISTLLLSVLLAAYIFAVLGVGIVRNSISLISLEQMPDYGILRCIGSTKRQLKNFIYLMGLTLELSGIILGTALGFVIYLALAATYHVRIGFHIVVLPLILLAFLGDLYFVMRENAAFVNRVPPIVAASGNRTPELTSGNENIKARKFPIIGKLFGFECEYALKSLLRNPSRFWKTVGSIGFGMGMVVVAVTVNNGVNYFLNGTANYYGYYQIFDYSPIDPALIKSKAAQSHSDSGSDNSDKPLSQSLESSRYIPVSKPVYSVRLYTQNPTELEEHFTSYYGSDSLYGSTQLSRAESYQNTAPEERYQKATEAILSGVDLFGYDQEDYRRLKSRLVAGTLELGENGILLVNHAYSYSAVQSAFGGHSIMENYTVTDYQVGDCITFVDFEALYDLTARRIAEETALATPEQPARLPLLIMNECLGELAAQGITKTYVIEGIVEKDATLTVPDGSAPHFILPLERFFQETGLTADSSAGHMFHMKGKRLDAPLKELCANPPEAFQITQITYLQIVQSLAQIQDIVFWVMFFVLFIMLLNIMNLLNTASGNLHLRSNEFAQLRVLGMSKKRLIRTIFLESILTAVFADFIGLFLGLGLSLILMRLINLLCYVEFHFAWGTYFFMALTGLILFGGSVCFRLNRLEDRIAGELHTPEM